MTKFSKKLTIIIPVFNEKETIKKIISKIINLTNLKKEIIVVDDCSNDGTDKVLKNLKKNINKLIFHKKNLGKGAAIRSAQKFVKGDVVIIQDADLEYDPKDYLKLLSQIQRGFSVVYGSRVLKKNRYFQRNSNFIRVFFNHMLTMLSNLLNNQKLTDAHTCYKMFLKDIFISIKLIEDGFSFCPEITTKIAKKNIFIKEVPIKYFPRSYDKGKKIKFTDGIKAIITLFKYRFS